MNPLLLLLLGFGGFMTATTLSSGDNTESVSRGARDDTSDTTDPAEDQDDGTGDDPADDPADNPVEDPVDDPVEDPVDDSTQAAVELTMVVYDMSAQSVVREVESGDSIDFGDDPVGDYTFAVEVSDDVEVGSVVLEYNGQTWLQNSYPYTLDEAPIDLSEGDFEITVTVYSERGGNGEVLSTESVTFETTSDAPADDDEEPVDDGMDHGSGDDDGMDHGSGDDDGMDHGSGDDDGDHGDHHGSEPQVPPPGADATAAEIDAYVEAVKASPEADHGHDGGMADEHMAAMDLVPRDEATHVAVNDGPWDDPDTWHNGEIPGDDAKVLIPEGIEVTYGQVSDTSLFTVRVDGTLDFETDTDSQMVFDTMVVSPTGSLVIGTDEDPVDPDVNIDLIVANNGPIDTDWDPMLLSRGIVAHGSTEMHGAEKDSHDKVTEDPMAGDTSITFEEPPEGWQVGDTIVIAGTDYTGYAWDNEIDGKRYYPTEDEERVITKIDDDGTVWFDEPLVHDHDSPRDDLKTSVANYTRNISIETEDAETAEVYERGHVMFMHSDDVDVSYVEFHELGRTDKSETSVDVNDVDNVQYDTNVQGRYPVHLHRTGVDDPEDPAIIEGTSVYGSPGWGYVHHDSNAILDNNASYDTFGAGYVAETGNETGVWNDNIAINAQGTKDAIPKNTSDISDTEFDTARGGDGFWFQGRMVESTNNVAASVNTGYVYFHRDGDDRMEEFDADLYEYPEALYYDDETTADDAAIRTFEGNEAFAANEGLHVVKANTSQGHDTWSHLEDFTAWSVETGAHLQYTSHYILEDFDVVGKETDEHGEAENGILLGGSNVSEVVIIDAEVEGFETGINLHKSFTNDAHDEEAHDYVVIDAEFTDVDQEYGNYDPDLDTILEWDDVTITEPSLDLDAPLTFDGSYEGVSVTGTKTDSLGETEYPGGIDNFDIKRPDVIHILEETGYWTTEDGQAYTLVRLYSTDRATGDIYYETHPIYIEDNVPLGSETAGSGRYSDVQDNGVLDIETVNGVQMVGNIPLETPTLAEPENTTYVYNEDEEAWETLTYEQGFYDEITPEEHLDDDMSPVSAFGTSELIL